MPLNHPPFLPRLYNAYLKRPIIPRVTCFMTWRQIQLGTWTTYCFGNATCIICRHSWMGYCLDSHGKGFTSNLRNVSCSPSGMYKATHLMLQGFRLLPIRPDEPLIVMNAPLSTSYTSKSTRQERNSFPSRAFCRDQEELVVN